MEYRIMKILFDNKEYEINKEKLLYVLEKLECSKVENKNIEKLMKKFNLFDEYFLENLNRL